jgi:L-threonylcarbamoyladenylate synthase
LSARLYDWADHATLVALLRNGGVVVLPTDTVYGFSCVAAAAPALDRIRALKGAGAERGFVTLAAAPQAIAPLLDSRQDARAWRFVQCVWPAPFTAVLAVRGAPPGAATTPAGATLAVRVPAHAALSRLLAEVAQPVVSTSVNAHGAPPLADVDAILSAFGTAVDAVVRDAQPASPRASTLADCTAWPPRLVRAGAFDLEAALARFDAAPPNGEP